MSSLIFLIVAGDSDLRGGDSEYHSSEWEALIFSGLSLEEGE
jgi:hypothetical protein